MQIDFKGKRVLVTGATSPIGRGTAKAYLDQGAIIAVHGPDQASVDSLTAELGGGDQIFGLVGKLSNLDNCVNVVDEAITRLGGLDILVNATDTPANICFEDVSPDDWDRGMDSFRAATFCTQRATESLKASGGNVVNVASIYGLMGGPAGMSVHSASMGSIVNLTRMTALRLGVNGIRANCVCYGMLSSSVSSWGISSADGTPALLDQKQILPMGRFGTAEDIAPSILFISSPYAAYMTGAVTVIDGGKHSGC